MNNEEKTISDQRVSGVLKPDLSIVPRKYAGNSYNNKVPAEMENGGEFGGNMIVTSKGKIDLSKGGYATIFHLKNLSSDPTDPAVIGDICIVNGILRRCSVAGFPGTWTNV